MSDIFAPPPAADEHRAKTPLCRAHGAVESCDEEHVCYLYRGHSAVLHKAKRCQHEFEGIT
jgi:hypothetical protein